MQCFLFHLAAEYLNQEVSAPSSDRLLNIRSTDSPYYLSPLILKISVLKYLWKCLFLYPENQQSEGKHPKHNPLWLTCWMWLDKPPLGARFMRKRGGRSRFLSKPSEKFSSRGC